jgi:hypothetical protein
MDGDPAGRVDHLEIAPDHPAGAAGADPRRRRRRQPRVPGLADRAAVVLLVGYTNPVPTDLRPVLAVIPSKCGHRPTTATGRSGTGRGSPSSPGCRPGRPGTRVIAREESPHQPGTLKSVFHVSPKHQEGEGNGDVEASGISTRTHVSPNLMTLLASGGAVGSGLVAGRGEPVG